MNQLAQNNYNSSEEGSGPRPIQGVSPQKELYRQSAEASFERALFDFEENPVIKPLLANKGLLKSVFDQLRDFSFKYFENAEMAFKANAQAKDLEGIFTAGMNKIVHNWPQLQAMRISWAAICEAMEMSFMKMAGALSLNVQFKAAVQNWYKEYTQAQAREKLLRERDGLNAEALKLSQDLAYLSGIGRADERLIDQTRKRISEIDKKLMSLPMPTDERELPAFSDLSQKVVLEGNRASEKPTYIKRAMTDLTASSGVSKKVVQTPTQTAPVSQKKSWYKKIPLIGRLFG